MPLRKAEEQPGFQTAICKIEKHTFFLLLKKKKKEKTILNEKSLSLRLFFYLITDFIKCGCDLISKQSIKCYIYEMDQNGTFTDSTLYISECCQNVTIDCPSLLIKEFWATD